MKQINLEEFFHKKKDDFSFSMLTNSSTLKDKNISHFLNRPGLALAGYFERFSHNRIQILGETEISYLQSLEAEVLFDRVKELFVYDIPCFIVAKGLSIPALVIDQANEYNIAILSSRLSTENLSYALRKYLDSLYAPTIAFHSTLVSVYGVGILITGSSGIGKSELALDLVERGHRLVTDDLVRIDLLNDVLIGRREKEIGYFMEIRGVGVIDVERMFGIQAVRAKKQIDIQVELIPWKENTHHGQVGNEGSFNMILEKKIQVIYLPVAPGKNVSMIFETIAMNHILKLYGYDAGSVYTQKLSDEIIRNSRINKELRK
ncbi:MAG: HPr(Ser) kinase/phosphatase [Candidatus Cloacimonetes bacterium]|nr:HPr(Ser) kinase/phosphatase [Candidatus Cloacimonadota bacterium]